MKKLASYLYIFTLTIPFIFSSCNNKTEQQELSEIDQLREDLIVVHDSAMSRMQTIMTLKNQLKEKKDSTESIKNNNITSTITQLEDADKAMMDWMHSLEISLNANGTSQPYDTVNDTKKIQYLKSKKDEMQAIDLKMKNAIKQAQIIIKK